MAVLRSCALDLQRLALLLSNLLFSKFPLATIAISSLTTISNPPGPPPSPHFFSNNNAVYPFMAYSDRSEELKKKVGGFFETPAAGPGLGS
jgi:hypothetical protein